MTPEATEEQTPGPGPRYYGSSGAGNGARSAWVLRKLS